MTRWTRTYCSIPSAYSVPGGLLAYSFIGLYGVYGIGVTTATGRERFSKSVPVRLYKEFFLCKDGQTYATPTAITVNAALGYYYDAAKTMATDFLADVPPFATATTPSRANYLTVVGGGTVSNVGTNGEIIAEDSRIVQFRGPIWCRETPYIKAQ